jgi:DNA-binding response OmpR family regulator
MTQRKILIVDDDADLRLGLGVRLRAIKYATVFAADGTTAIAMAQRERPDLILLDLGLPAGDGFLVLERLRAIPKLAAIPVVVITARDVEESRERALDLGAVAFLQKPVDNAALLTAIRLALREDIE